MLLHTNVPTVIVECGFLSNPDEAGRLNSEAYQQKVAYGIYCGIMEYLTDSWYLYGYIKYYTDIDSIKINIKEATRLAMKNALEGLNKKPQIVLIDAERIDTHIKQLNIVKGDLYEYSISCASILAKVRRDKIMENFSKIYPYYSFETNAGYGTKKHYDGLEKYGECPIHRKTFLRKFYERQLSFLWKAKKEQ